MRTRMSGGVGGGRMPPYPDFFRGLKVKELLLHGAYPSDYELTWPQYHIPRFLGGFVELEAIISNGYVTL